MCHERISANRGGDFMQWRLPLNFGRERNLQNRTAVYAVLLPPLHETSLGEGIFIFFPN